MPWRTKQDASQYRISALDSRPRNSRIRESAWLPRIRTAFGQAGGVNSVVKHANV